MQSSLDELNAQERAAYRAPEGAPAAERCLRWLAVVLAAGMTAYQVYVAIFGPPITEAHRPTHFLFGASLVFALAAPVDWKRTRLRLLCDILLLAAVLLPSLYLIVNASGISGRMVYVTPVTPLQNALGILVMIAVLEATRRMLGWPMVVIALVFLVYTQLGPHLPYPLWHRGYSLSRVIEQMYLTLDGLWGTPMGASSNYIFLFVLFGALMVSSGAGTFFSNFANAVAGGYTGGPAKTAVVSSALMSTLSGSSTANVVTTGSFTIPAMKAYGYAPTFAAGVEALASTGGLITPPVMGAAAFIMADFLGVPYSQIMYAAAIPAMLYFVSIFVSVDLEARKLGLKPMAFEKQAAGDLVRGGLSMLVPLGVIIWFLLDGYTPTVAALYGIVALIVSLPAISRIGPKRMLWTLWTACLAAPRMMAPIVVACAIGGAIAGIISMTGLGVRITTIIASLAGDNTLLFLVLTMLVSIVLGMGMPTSAVYIILASVLAPGLIDLGFEPIAVHMFVFYGAVMSNITPPLAMASFAAAAIARSDPWATSVSAVRTGLIVFLVPFLFCYAPELIGQGDALSVAHAAATALLGIFLMAAASTGWLLFRLGILLRLLLAAAAVLLIVPGWVGDVAGLAMAGGVFILLLGRRAHQKRQGELRS